MTTESPAILSIGAILGDSGAENQAWKRAINTISNRVQNLPTGVSSPLLLNVIYHVDGRIPNEFEGVRTGRFDKKTTDLIVQAAVPLTPVEDRQVLLLDLLERAVDEAEAFARKKGLVEAGLSEIRYIVAQLKESAS